MQMSLTPFIMMSLNLWIFFFFWYGKNPPANVGDIRDAGSIPGSGRSPGGGHGNPLQYSCLENPIEELDKLQSIGSQGVRHD